MEKHRSDNNVIYSRIHTAEHREVDEPVERQVLVLFPFLVAAEKVSFRLRKPRPHMSKQNAGAFKSKDNCVFCLYPFSNRIILAITNKVARQGSHFRNRKEKTFISMKQRHIYKTIS